MSRRGKGTPDSGGYRDGPGEANTSFYGTPSSKRSRDLRRKAEKQKKIPRAWRWDASVAEACLLRPATGTAPVKRRRIGLKERTTKSKVNSVKFQFYLMVEEGSGGGLKEKKGKRPGRESFRGKHVEAVRRSPEGERRQRGSHGEPHCKFVLFSKWREN